MNVTQKGILTLVKSAITGEKYELPKEFELDAEETQELIKKHHLMMLLYIGAMNCGFSSETPVMQWLFAFYCKRMISSENQLKEVQRVFQAFDENGIDYLPTKGCKMKALYPKPEMRVMGDADITIRAEQSSKISRIMQELGFELYESGEGTDVWDSRHLHLELHRHMRSFYNENYYDDVWERVESVGGNQYAFKTEDAFIHIFNHFARHYRSGGIGCRHIIDLYVFRRAFPKMDEKYIYDEMCKIHLQKFYENVCDLLDVWFADAVSNPVTETITQYIFSSGSWGSLKSHAAARNVELANETGATSNFRFIAIWKTIFPGMDFMKERYGVLEKAPYLLPVTWVLRWGKAIFVKNKYVPDLVKEWNRIDDDRVLEYQERFRFVGLDIENEKE